MSWGLRGAVVLTCGVVLAGFAWAPGALAGEYHVYSCRQPSGAPAPADGWSPSAVVAEDSATDTCSEGGSLTAALRDVGEHETNVDLATWEFSTPWFDSMVGARLWRAGEVAGGGNEFATYWTWLTGSNENVTFDECIYVNGCPAGVGDPTVPLSAENMVIVPTANLGAHLYVHAGCAGASENECPAGRGDANGDAAAIHLYAADIVLEQDAGPNVSNVSGELESSSTLSGVTSVIFSASDPGAGVWETQFTVDGQLVQSSVPDDNEGRCRDVGEGTDGLPAFLYLQPCPASESVDVPLSTIGLSNGVHHFVVSVLDAAGNSAAVLDRKIDVENPATAAAGGTKPATEPAPAGTRKRARLTLEARPRRVSSNQRIRFSGQLQGGSIPRRGKVLVVQARRGRGRWSQVDLVRTGARGRYHGSYPFTFLGPGEWQLRVLCEGKVGYPFATGWSNVVRVRVV